MPHLTTELEEIFTDNERSISLMVNPNLSDFFFWHFHPEYELVYIEAANGPRHVGEHMSRFTGSDLVMIGPDIPHLNFDYGIKGPYQKRVIHFRHDFLSGLEGTPELDRILVLLQESRYGLAFGDQAKKLIRKRIMLLHDKDPFTQFLETLSLLRQLAGSNDKIRLHDHPVKERTRHRDHQRLKRIFAYVENHYHEKIDNRQVAEMTSLTYEAFCRYFKKMTRLTFTEFVNQYRIDRAKKLLLQDNTISEVCYDCGFESLSYFNRIFRKLTGVNPSNFRKKYAQ